MNMKKSFCALVGSLCLALSANTVAYAQTGTVTATSLNIRSYTTTTSDIIAKVPNGTELDILAGDGTWYKVQLEDGNVGYASAEYISLNEAYYGVVTASKLIVRSSTGINSSAITTLTYGSVVELLVYDGSWYKIRYDENRIGYVSAKYISTDLSLAKEAEEYVVHGYVCASSLNIRSTTSTSSVVITRINLGTKVEILAYDGLWYKVRLSDGREGYASADYISLSPVDTSSSTSIVSSSGGAVKYSSVPEIDSPASDSTIATGQAVIETAKKYIGRPYVWAAEGPDSFDCSGFTMYVMNKHGIKLPHQSGLQFNYGYSVPKDSLIAGDLVFFCSSRTTSVAHVGIYIGDGNFIHASSGSAKGVTISSLSAAYYKSHYLGARRII